MSTKTFPLEKIFGSRTRVKIITLFTTGVKRPYFVREIARNIDERLNAVRRELAILQKIGMLTTHTKKRRKYYELNPSFILLGELSGIMHKSGPGIQDTLFKNIERLSGLKYACATGYFTGASEAPTDLLFIGNINEKQLEQQIKHVEEQLDREITYTPMTETEFKYRRDFNDVFLRSIFSGPYKEMVNKLDADLKPHAIGKERMPMGIK